MELRRPGEWETTEDEDVALMDESWRRLREEIDHIDEHWTDAKKYALVDDDDNLCAEMYAIVKHIECINEGLSSIYPTFIHTFCRPRVMATLVRDKLHMVVADMIRKACEGGELKPVEVVRSSGIVVAKELP